MKIIVLILLSLFNVYAYAQDSLRIKRIENFFPTINRNIIYSEIVKVDTSLNKDDIYVNAKDFIIKSLLNENSIHIKAKDFANKIFISDKEVIQVDDQEKGIIYIRAFFNTFGHNGAVINPQIWFILKIEIKDGRYKYTISDLWYKGYISYFWHATIINKRLEDWSGAYSTDEYSSIRRNRRIYFKLTPFMLHIDKSIKTLIVNLKENISTSNKSDW